MTDKPKYYDIRSKLWREVFASAESYADYLDHSPQDKADNWRAMESKIPALTDEQVQRLSGLNRRLSILVSTGVWCGDCVRQGPMFQRIADVCGADLRWIDRDANEQLRDELRIVGAMRVPMVLFLTEDFHELGRFGDRTLWVYRKKFASEIGAACAVPYAKTPADQLAAEQGEWVDIFERMLLMARLAPSLRQKPGD